MEEVNIFDPNASVVYVNNSSDPNKNTVNLSLSVPLKTGMNLISIKKEDDAEETDGRYAKIKVDIEDPNYHGGNAPSYDAPAETFGTNYYTIPDLLGETFKRDYAGVDVTVYAISTDGKNEAEAKKRKISKSKSVVIN